MSIRSAARPRTRSGERVGQPLGREVRLPAELHDAGRDLVGVRLLLVRMLQELGRHGLGVDAARHVVCLLVAQDADDLGRERLVQEAEDGVELAAVTGGHGPLRMCLRARATDRLEVGQEILAMAPPCGGSLLPGIVPLAA